jgi:phospholipid-binding lipoprotein MlaA
MTTPLPLHKLLILILPTLLAGGCATLEGPREKKDPFESMNRAVFEFNDGFDHHILRPVAETYDAALPARVNTSISNLFRHVDDVVVLINDVLQLKGEQTASDVMRFTYNSVFGLCGLFDVASHMDLPKHNEDFGQTLGRWGVGGGPYIVLPILGPSTLRDTPSLVVDWQTDPITTIEGTNERWATRGLEAVDTRAGLLRASRILDTAALDRYVFMRDAYLQRRNNLVYDGNPPKDELDDFDPFAEEEFDPLAEEPPPAE